MAPSAARVSPEAIPEARRRTGSPTVAKRPATRSQGSSPGERLLASAQKAAAAAGGSHSSTSHSGAPGIAGCSMRTYSMAPRPTSTRMTTKKPSAGRRKVASSASGTPTAAVSSRLTAASVPSRRRSSLPDGRGLGLVGGDAAVPALAALVLEDGLEQLAAPEVRPEGVGDPDLRVGDLPEQEVGDAHLAGGADQQVGIGQPGGVEVAAERLLVDVGPLARRPVGDDAPAGVDDLATPRVVERDVEPHAAAAGGGGECALERVDHGGIELAPAAQHLEVDV